MLQIFEQKRKKRKKKNFRTAPWHHLRKLRTCVYIHRRSCIYCCWILFTVGEIASGGSFLPCSKVPWECACAPSLQLRPRARENPSRPYANASLAFLRQKRCTPFPAKHSLASFGIFIIPPPPPLPFRPPFPLHPSTNTWRARSHRATVILHRSARW